MNLWGSKANPPEHVGSVRVFCPSPDATSGGQHALQPLQVHRQRSGDRRVPLNTTTGNRVARQPHQRRFETIAPSNPFAWRRRHRRGRKPSAGDCAPDHRRHSVLPSDCELHLGKVHGRGIRLAVKRIRSGAARSEQPAGGPLDAATDESRNCSTRWRPGSREQLRSAGADVTDREVECVSAVLDVSGHLEGQLRAVLRAELSSAAGRGRDSRCDPEGDEHRDHTIHSTICLGAMGDAVARTPRTSQKAPSPHS